MKKICLALLCVLALSAQAEPTAQEKAVFEQQIMPAYQRGDWDTMKRLCNKMADTTKDMEVQVAMRQMAIKADVLHGTTALQRGDGKTALKYLTLAANAGDTNAMSLMGTMYMTGAGGIIPDRARGVALIQQAARLGDTGAQDHCRRLHIGW